MKMLPNINKISIYCNNSPSMKGDLARKYPLISGMVTYFPDHDVYYYNKPKVYYDIRRSRYVRMRQRGGGPTEQEMRIAFGPPPQVPSVGSIPYIPGSQPVADFDLDAISAGVAQPPPQYQPEQPAYQPPQTYPPPPQPAYQPEQPAYQSPQAYQPEQPTYQSPPPVPAQVAPPPAPKKAKVSKRKKAWSGFKKGFTNLFKTHPCGEWRETGKTNADKYRDSWSSGSLNGCCSNRSQGCSQATSRDSPCVRDGEANPGFNDACANILLAQARQLSYQKLSSRLDVEERCSSVMREAQALLGDGNNWYRENCTNGSGRMPAGDTLRELEESVGPSWSSDSSNPLAEQEALRAELFQDSGSLVSIDKGPILDRVCQMCREDEASLPEVSLQGEMGLDMLGIDSDNSRVKMMNMRRGQY
jgi:hypothetical protein